MMNRFQFFLRYIFSLLPTKYSSESGQSIIIFAFAIVGLMGMIGLAVDLGLVYIERVQINRAVDAAVLAGVVELPSEEDAINRAIEFLRLNGFEAGKDVEVFVRGCVTSAGGNVNENPSHPLSGSSMTEIDTLEGHLYIPATEFTFDDKPRATFVIDTGSFRNDDSISNSCDDNNGDYGSATKLKVYGESRVQMNFMRLPALGAFSEIGVREEAVAESVVDLDIMLVFDVSGSMEFQTACHDCWVKTSEVDATNLGTNDYPKNGYFNPIPFPPNVGLSSEDGFPPTDVNLCSSGRPTYMSAVGNDKDSNGPGYHYRAHEAEFYSYNSSNWDLSGRSPGQGFWAVQRGSRTERSPGSYYDRRTANEVGGVDVPPFKDFWYDRFQGNQAGNVANQSANSCNPALYPTTQKVEGLCSSNSQSICDQPINIGGQTVGPIDCSAYIQAQPFANYEGSAGSGIIGGTYDLSCLTTGTCWSGSSYGNAIDNSPPWVEYDFANEWGIDSTDIDPPDTPPSGVKNRTYIWVRAIGGSQMAYQWLGQNAPLANTDRDREFLGWQQTILWEVVDNDGLPVQSYDNNNSAISLSNGGYYAESSVTKPMSSWGYPNNNGGSAQQWRDNRAQNEDWQWIRLGSVDANAKTLYTLKIYQGSAGYKIDRVVFTNDFGHFEYPDRNYYTDNNYDELTVIGTTIYSYTYDINVNALDVAGQRIFNKLNQNDGLGPRIGLYTATREACNACNPIYGRDVDQGQCLCPSFGSGSDTGLCRYIGLANDVQSLNDDLYGGVEPLRSAQQAVKRFVQRLDPKFDQVGFVAFHNDVVSTSESRSKLQCRNYAAANLGGADNCFAGTDPISFTNVLAAIENQWPLGGTDIAEGLREGLEELGVDTPGNTLQDHLCSTEIDDGSACDRLGSARKIVILITDGRPTDYPGNPDWTPNYGSFTQISPSDPNHVDNCSATGAGVSFWDDPETLNENYECSMFYAFQAYDNGVTLYTIGLGGAVDSNLLEAMATGRNPKTGTTYFAGVGGKFYPAASPSELDAIFDDILSNIYVKIIG